MRTLERDGYGIDTGALMLLHAVTELAALAMDAGLAPVW